MLDTKKHNDSILVLGAGQLGIAVLQGVTKRIGSAATRVTVLLRPPSDEQEMLEERQQEVVARALGVNIVHADLASDSVSQLATKFAPFSTVVSCTGFVAGRGTQRKLTAAVLEAGVERYVPWQFGVDYDEVGRGSGQDVWDEQLDVRDMLRAQSGTNWIIVSTGMFTSFLFEPAFGVVDLANNRVHALGSWEHQVTVTTPQDVGRLTAEILFTVPAIRNEAVFVAGDTLSYAQLADEVDRGLGRTVERVEWSVDELASRASADPEDDLRKYRLAFARDNGVAWALDRTFNAAQGIPVTDVRSWISQNLT